MVSAINPAYPVTGNPTTQSVRDNFQHAHDEITALQNTPPGSGIGTVNVTAPITGGGSTATVTVGLGNVPPANLNGGTNASSTTYWRGDGTWATPPAGTGGVTSIAFTSPGLTGGTINTANPTGTVALGQVQVANLANGTGASNATYWRGDGSWQTPPTSAPAADTVNAAVAAAGTTQGTATALTAVINAVTTGSGGVALPVATAGAHQYVRNSLTSALSVYPASGAAINALTANVPVIVPADTTALLVAVTATQWYTVP
jgi:hypothetical protein